MREGVPSAISILQRELDDSAVSQVSGNAPRRIKELPIKWFAVFHRQKVSFAQSVTDRIKVVEVSLVQNPEDRSKTEGRVVCEIDVTEDMLNAHGVMAEGCAILLIDECTVVSLAVMEAATGSKSMLGVTQAINTMFHGQAPMGSKLRIVGTSMSADGEMRSCRGEIWDATHSRLIASGAQLQMSPQRNHSDNDLP